MLLNKAEAVSTGDSTDDAEEARCIVTLSVLVDSVNVQLYHKVLPFVSIV